MPPRTGDTPCPQMAVTALQGKQANKSKPNPCESPGSAFPTLQLPLAMSKFLFSLHLPATVLSAKRKGVWLRKHHVLFTAHQCQMSDQTRRMLNHIPVTHRQFYCGSSSLNQRITAHCHTCKDTQKEVFWFSSILNAVWRPKWVHTQGGSEKSRVANSCFSAFLQLQRLVEQQEAFMSPIPSPQTAL